MPLSLVVPLLAASIRAIREMQEYESSVNQPHRSNFIMAHCPVLEFGHSALYCNRRGVIFPPPNFVTKAQLLVT